MRLVVGAAQAQDAVVAVQEGLRVVAQAARVVEDDVLEIRAARRDLQQLVDLLLVLDDGEVDVGVVQHVDHFLGHRVLVERHRNAAERLHRGHRPVQARAVVADDREVHPALEAQRREAAGQRAHFLRDLRPGPRLPDAEVLLARGRMAAAHLRVVLQESAETYPARLQLGRSTRLDSPSWAPGLPRTGFAFPPDSIE